MMNGGGDFEMAAYSLVKRFVAAGVAIVYGCVGGMDGWGEVPRKLCMRAEFVQVRQLVAEG
jgi:hypothetical protein